MNKPLVTVMCLCYNHAPFLEEALDSVYQQSYPNLQVILIDNNSADNSSQILEKYYQQYSEVSHLVLNKENKGNCKAINDVLPLVKGKYVVDFATDDVFVSNRIEEQVTCFENLSDDYGIIHTNAEMIDENTKTIGFHTEQKNIKISTGQVYVDIVERYFLCPSTMLVKKEIFDVLQGYDEGLAYEDWDFLVRTARVYKIHYLDKVLTKRRVLKNSMYSLFFKRGNYKMLESTYKICEKIHELNRTKEEDKALVKRIHHEMKYALKSKHYNLVKAYGKMLENNEKINLKYKLLFLTNNFLFFMRKKSRLF